jgi:hypothetical protein
MTTTAVQTVVAAAQQLSLTEQFEVLQTLERVLQQHYLWSPFAAGTTTTAIPNTVRRTPPVTNLADFAADFWPEDESADDINNYLAHQRVADQTSDLPQNSEML